MQKDEEVGEEEMKRENNNKGGYNIPSEKEYL